MLRSLTLLLACLGGVGEPDDARLSSRVTSLRTRDPTDEDFSDLEPLVDRIGSASVVQLCEESHGEGSTFLARSRIIRFLHQRMQFDVIVFESPFGALRDIDEAMSSELPLDEVLDQGLYACWGGSAQMRPLFEYVRASRDTPSPITLAGCDSQVAGAGEAERLADRLVAFLGKDPAGFGPAEAEELRQVIDDLRADSGVRLSATRFAEHLRMLQRATYALRSPSTRLRALTSPLDREWHERAIETLKQTSETKHLQSLAPPFSGDFAAYAEAPSVHAAQNRRDRAMADNLLWYHRRAHPGHRIIVWAASSHSQEDERGWVEGNESFPAVRVSTLGRYLKGMLGEQLFTVLATAYEGTAAAPARTRVDGTHEWSTWNLEPARAGSLESRLHELGILDGFVDIRGLGLRTGDVRFELHDDQSLPLDDFCDAILFVDRMRPSRPAK